jgi:prepilin-type N-terminal cleavage/methylation domain-containing protein
MSQRRGFTLVEVLLALVIMGVVTGAIYRLLNTNQRLALAQAEQVSLQSNVRTGSLIVPSELRELNTWQGGAADRNDILDPKANSVRYRSGRGMGFLCQNAAAGATKLVLAQSNWTGLRPPDADRDDLHIFIDGDPYDDNDDGWNQLNLTGVAPGNACGGALSWALTVPAIPADVPANTPVRLFEVMQLQLYADAAGEWWLGAQSVSALDPAPVPILGPLTANGFQLQYLDSTGVATADLTAINSVRLTVRGLTDAPVRTGGQAPVARTQEALVTQVLLRNSVRP